MLAVSSSELTLQTRVGTPNTMNTASFRSYAEFRCHGRASHVKVKNVLLKIYGNDPEEDN